MKMLFRKHSFKQWSGKEKRFELCFIFFRLGKLSLFCLVYTFLMKNFIQMLKTLNEQENGGVGVVLGRKVGYFVAI